MARASTLETGTPTGEPNIAPNQPDLTGDPASPSAPPPEYPSRAAGKQTGKVTVACKLPHGLDLGFAVLKGSNATDFYGNPDVVGGYGFTDGVDAELMAKWRDDNPDNVAVRKGLIFFGDRPEYVRLQAREQAEIDSGFEQLDPTKMPPGLEPATKED